MLTICDHTIEETLLHKESMVLDLGSRNFQFALPVSELVNHVFSIDAEDVYKGVGAGNVSFFQYAVVSKSLSGRVLQYVKYGNGTGNFIRSNEPIPKEATIENIVGVSIEELSKRFRVPFWDLIKFDIEGSEYEILMEMDRPIAKQLTVEFHEHTAKKKGLLYINDLYDHLYKWYDIKYQDYSEKHGCGLNFWDVLFVLKKELLSQPALKQLYSTDNDKK